jgi:replicative DNA helicase
METAENLEIEQNLLGHLLAKNVTVFNLQAKLKPHHFAEKVHQEIYARIVDGVVFRQEATNPATLKGWAESNETLKALCPENPVRYLANLAYSGLVVISPEQYAEAIIRMWMLRKAQEQARRLLELASNADADPDEVIGKIHAELLNIRSGGIAKALDSKTLTARMIEGLTVELPIDSTGIPRLDNLMGGGLIQGKLYGFFARKKVGKTSMAATIAYNLEKQGIRHAFICGEMGPEEIHEKVLSRQMQVFPSSFRNKGFRSSNAFMHKMADAHASTNGLTQYYDAPGLTFDDLKGMVSEAKYRYGVNGVILDYLQLVGGKSSKTSEASHLDAVSQWLAEAAKKYKIWIMALGQINQEGNTRGGEGIRHACDMCIEIHREDITQPTAWLEMKDSRYMPYGNMGDKDNPALIMREHGQYFEEIAA